MVIEKNPRWRIEKNIPMPTKAGRSPLEWPFSKMGIGDSVLFNSPSKNYGYVRRKFKEVADKEHKVFAARTVDGGLRVWRMR